MKLPIWNRQGLGFRELALATVLEALFQRLCVEFTLEESFFALHPLFYLFFRTPSAGYRTTHRKVPKTHVEVKSR